MDIGQIKTFVENNPTLVQMKPSVKYPDLFVLKYAKKVFWDNLWTPELERCRGLVVDKDWNVVVRPFNKIYNYGIEDRAPKFEPTEYVRAYRKVNGFMAAITYTEKYGLLISTTGSLDSEYCDMIQQVMTRYNFYDLVNILQDEKQFGYTHLFECVHGLDPHIIPEFSGMYYLGSMSHDLQDDWVWHDNGVSTVFDQIDSITCRLCDLEDHVKTVKHEGYVFYSKQGLASKIKSPYYLINKFFARKQSIDDVVSHKAKEIFDEEYYPLIKHIENNQKFFTSLTEQERLSYIREFIGG